MVAVGEAVIVSAVTRMQRERWKVVYVLTLAWPQGRTNQRVPEYHQLCSSVIAQAGTLSMDLDLPNCRKSQQGDPGCFGSRHLVHSKLIPQQWVSRRLIDLPINMKHHMSNDIECKEEMTNVLILR